MSDVVFNIDTFMLLVVRILETTTSGRFKEQTVYALYGLKLRWVCNGGREVRTPEQGTLSENNKWKVS
jgi:hypothetical protein